MSCLHTTTSLRAFVVYYCKVIKEIRLLIMDDLTHKEMRQLIYRTPVSQIHENDLNMIIQSYFNMVMESYRKTNGVSDEDIESNYESNYRVIHSMFITNAYYHPDTSAMEIMDMCLVQSVMNDCLDLKPARNTKGFGNS